MSGNIHLDPPLDPRGANFNHHSPPTEPDRGGLLVKIAAPSHRWLSPLTASLDAPSLPPPILASAARRAPRPSVPSPRVARCPTKFKGTPSFYRLAKSPCACMRIALRFSKLRLDAGVCKYARFCLPFLVRRGARAIQSEKKCLETNRYVPQKRLPMLDTVLAACLLPRGVDIDMGIVAITIEGKRGAIVAST